MFLLGYDIGSSSVKASLVDAETGKCVASAFFPKTEAGIIAVRPGWAEQEPESWWENLKLSTRSILSESRVDAKDIKAIGISYQMHGLVCVDKRQRTLRPAIIWCDSRAVSYGQRAFEAIGEKFCLAHLLNSAGNFTASKLAWVKENEPDIYEQIDKIDNRGTLRRNVLGLPKQPPGRLPDAILRNRSFADSRHPAYFRRTGATDRYGCPGTRATRRHSDHLPCRRPAQQRSFPECVQSG